MPPRTDKRHAGSPPDRTTEPRVRGCPDAQSTPAAEAQPVWLGAIGGSARGGGLGFPVSAQTVRGVVVGAESGESIEGVRLILRDLEGLVLAATISDDAGRFELQMQSGGMLRLEVGRLGYADWVTSSGARPRLHPISCSARPG